MMKKSNKRIKVKAEINQTSEQSDDNSNEKEKEKEKENESNNEKDSSLQNVYRCPKCFSIPLINVKDNENKVIIDCLQGHHVEMLFSEYMTSEFQKNSSKLECSHCGADKNTKKLMKICYECKKIFCKECLSSHNKSNPNHHTNTIEKMDIICPLHKSKYSHYCPECKKNLCDECIKTKNDGHQLILFKNINLKNNELIEIKNNLEKENEILFKIKKIFNDTLVTLSNKFNDIMSYKFLCLKYKNNIINTYETKDTNYQIIDNVNHLKFITKDLKIEPEMNELDIIYELFNFLDSIEYNDENNNINMNENNSDNSYSNINNSTNIGESNKIIIDTKNKILESEHEDDNETEKENTMNDNNKNLENKNIKVEENEKEDEEDEKRDETEREQESDNNKVKNDFIKISDNNNDNSNHNEKDDEKEDEKHEETENSNEINKNINHNPKINSIDDIVNQVTPSKITKKVIIKKKEVLEMQNNLNNNNIYDINENNKEDQNKKKESNENNNDNDNDDNDEDMENEENMYIYKSNSHIPVVSNSNQNSSEKEKLSQTDNLGDDSENKEKEPKKRKKKIVKKKKLKQLLEPISKTETETKTVTKTKKKIIKRTRTKDKLLSKDEEKEEEQKEEIKKDEDQNNEDQKDERQKEEPNEEKEEESKEKNNNNIHIEVNDNDSKDIINNNIHIEVNENDSKENANEINRFEDREEKAENNNKEDESKDDITDENNISKNEEDDQEKEEGEQDNISNDIKIEEVPNTNHEEFKENKSVKKKTKHIKKKKKKRLNITKTEQVPQTNPQIEIINTEKKIEKTNIIYNNKPKNKMESLRYQNHEEEGDDQDNLEAEEHKIEKSSKKIEKQIELLSKDDEDNKSKKSRSSKKNKIIAQKRNLDSSDKEEDYIENNSINKININTDINEKNKYDDDINSKINKFNKIVDVNLNIDNDQMSSSRGSHKIKKRKKIKKKKYLICVDNNGDIKQPNPEQKQIKITKTTTLIRSRSKDKPSKNEATKDSSSSKKNKVIKNKEINFKIIEDGDNSSNYNDENSSSNKKKEVNNIRIKKNVKKIDSIKKDLGIEFASKGTRKMRMTQGKNKAAFLLENTEEIYLQEKSILKAKNKGLDTLQTEIDYDRNLNRSVDGYNSYRNRRRLDEYNYDEINYLIERSNSYKKMKNYKKFNEREKINCMKFENGISCLLEINPTIFALGNLIGDIIVINSHSYKQMQVISEHDGTIISLCLLHDKSILSCSADRKMLKIRINQNGTKYIIEFIFTGYENYILKGIELMNTFKIITCSWDDKLFVWDPINENNYKNSLIFNEGERVVDLLEISYNYFVSISESNELKIWGSDTCELIDTIKNIKCIGAPNALCKINDMILCVLDYHEIQLIDIMEHRLINKISVDDGNLSCIIKLNDNSILLAEDFNSDKYCVFYMKQFYYEYEDLKPISYKKDKFFKTNKNNDKEIRALVQFSNGVIVQGVTGEYNGNDSGDLFFYY